MSSWVRARWSLRTVYSFMKMERRLLNAIQYVQSVAFGLGWVGLERVEESKVLHIPILCVRLVF